MNPRPDIVVISADERRRSRRGILSRFPSPVLFEPEPSSDADGRTAAPEQRPDPRELRTSA